MLENILECLSGGCCALGVYYFIMSIKHIYQEEYYSSKMFQYLALCMVLNVIIKWIRASHVFFTFDIILFIADLLLSYIYYIQYKRR